MSPFLLSLIAREQERCEREKERCVKAVQTLRQGRAATGQTL